MLPCLTMGRLSTGPVPVVKDENGFWEHPDIPWNLIPEDTSCAPYFQAWGYEWRVDELQFEDSEVADKYWESGEPDISAWEPKQPKGDGWFLATIYDTEDGPCACWLKHRAQLTQPTN